MKSLVLHSCSFKLQSASMIKIFVHILSEKHGPTASYSIYTIIIKSADPRQPLMTLNWFCLSAINHFKRVFYLHMKDRDTFIMSGFILHQHISVLFNVAYNACQSLKFVANIKENA